MSLVSVPMGSVQGEGYLLHRQVVERLGASSVTCCPPRSGLPDYPLLVPSHSICEPGLGAHQAQGTELCLQPLPATHTWTIHAQRRLPRSTPFPWEGTCHLLQFPSQHHNMPVPQKMPTASLTPPPMCPQRACAASGPHSKVRTTPGSISPSTQVVQHHGEKDRLECQTIWVQIPAYSANY